MKLPNLQRTADAIDAHDEALRAFNETADDQDVLRVLKSLDDTGGAVGHAFGLDTSDRNDFETCRACVRPGHPNPAGGDADLSFVRRMVKSWKEESP